MQLFLTQLLGVSKTGPPADANTGAVGRPGQFLTYVCMLLLPRSLSRDNSIDAPVVLFPTSETPN